MSLHRARTSVGYSGTNVVVNSYGCRIAAFKASLMKYRPLVVGSVYFICGSSDISCMSRGAEQRHRRDRPSVQPAPRSSRAQPLANTNVRYQRLHR